MLSAKITTKKAYHQPPTQSLIPTSLQPIARTARNIYTWARCSQLTNDLLSTLLRNKKPRTNRHFPLNDYTELACAKKMVHVSLDVPRLGQRRAGFPVGNTCSSTSAMDKNADNRTPPPHPRLPPFPPTHPRSPPTTETQALQVRSHGSQKSVGEKISPKQIG